jgi:hypothetical protein
MEQEFLFLLEAIVVKLLNFGIAMLLVLRASLIKIKDKNFFKKYI